MRQSPPLTLKAHTSDDFEAMSMLLQDAVLRVGDMTYLAKERRFVAVMNRYRWEVAQANQRVRTALNVGGVMRVQFARLNRHQEDAVLSLLALRFDETDAPSGTLSLVFSGGSEIRLEVESCDAILEDITQSWLAHSRPQHNIPESDKESDEES